MIKFHKGSLEIDAIVILVFIVLIFAGTLGGYFYRAHQDKNDVANAVKTQSQTDATTYAELAKAAQDKSDAQLAVLKAQGQQQLAAANQKVQQILTRTNQEITAIENAPTTPCLNQIVPDIIIEQFLPITSVVAPIPPALVKSASIASLPMNKLPSLVGLAVNLPHSIMYVSIQGEQP